MLPRVDTINAEEHSWLLLNSPDHITDFIRSNGFWGEKEANIAKVILANRRSVNVLDIGANIGGFALPIAKFISPLNGKLHAFEPQRIVFQQLCANVFLNRLDNVHTYNVAIGDVDCRIQIPELDFWKSKNIGGFSVDESIREQISREAKAGITFENSESEIVQNTVQHTLDSFEFAFRIDLIKVDVEGYELEVFTGGVRTIEANNFPPIIFEVWAEKDWYQEKANKTKKVLADLGYEFTQLGRDIIAQHPRHPFRCRFDYAGNEVTISRE